MNIGPVTSVDNSLECANCAAARL